MKKLRFLDESSVNFAYTRLYGRAKGGARIYEGGKDVRFSRQSILSTIGLDGTQVPIVFEGTLNKELFVEYLEKMLFPTLGEDDILILDNSSVHTSKLVRETIKRLGIKAVYLPPYSPDLNPIELMWAYVKTILRRIKARNEELLIAAINTALSTITQDLIAGWVKHCNYGL